MIGPNIRKNRICKSIKTKMCVGGFGGVQNDGLGPTKILGGRQACLRVGGMAAGTFWFLFFDTFSRETTNTPCFDHTSVENRVNSSEFVENGR